MPIDRTNDEFNGRSPSGRATHERSQSSLSPPTVGIPNAGDLATALSYLDSALWTLLDNGKQSELGRRHKAAASIRSAVAFLKMGEKCPLGEMHGWASSFERADGVRCCDFCWEPISPPAENGQPS